jgi:glycerol-3-phosphate dehydrogenase
MILVTVAVSFQDISKESGVTLIDNHPVLEIVPSPDSVTVTCKKEGNQKVEFRAKGIVLCAGPWTNKLTEPLG